MATYGAHHEKKECYIFVDNSNLFIAGQTVHGQKLVDTDKDPRFRVDMGNLFTMLVKDRTTSGAFLYGSIPPPNDSIWKAARENNFEVKVFERSEGGHEKEVDVAMGCDITEQNKEERHFLSL